jgi:hypothetical protein
VEDETLELHFKTLKEGTARVEETTSALFGEIAKTNEWVGDVETEVREARTDVTTLQEKFKNNPILQLGAGTVGGGGFIAIVLNWESIVATFGG